MKIGLAARPPGLRRHRRATAWLAVLALLGNVLSGAWAMAKAAAPADGLLGPHVICTSEGLVTLPAEDGSPPPVSTSTHCPACTLVPGVALLVALSFVGPAFAVVPLDLAPPNAEPVPVRRPAPGGLGSRAPPASA
jgi:hypothetical protein